MKDRVEFGTASWSVEDLGAGLEEDCSEMLWNQASFLHRGMSKQNCDASLPHLASDDTLFDQFSNNFSRLSLNTQSNLPSGLSTSNSSLHSEVAALGRDFSKDFYTLVRVASEKSFSEEIRCEYDIIYIPIFPSFAFLLWRIKKNASMSYINTTAVAAFENRVKATFIEHMNN